MALNKNNPTATAAWNQLTEHFKQIESKHLKELFAEDP